MPHTKIQTSLENLRTFLTSDSVKKHYACLKNLNNIIADEFFTACEQSFLWMQLAEYISREEMKKPALQVVTKGGRVTGLLTLLVVDGRGEYRGSLDPLVGRISFSHAPSDGDYMARVCSGGQCGQVGISVRERRIALDRAVIRLGGV